jgi:type 1 fimbriae regulatory protein FimB/type 1 fimbriae regulatory protein FimE
MAKVLRFPTDETQGPNTKNRKVARGSPRKRAAKPRKHLTEEEVERLIKAARETGRYGERDAALILLAYRHGFRVSELVALTWQQVDLKGALVHVARRKNGTPSTQPLTGRELRALRALLRGADGSPWVFNTERGASMTTDNVRKVIERAGVAAGLPWVSPHALRHACGFTLANKGTDTRTIQAYLGHRNIQHTVRYTELAPGRFKGLFSD